MKPGTAEAEELKYLHKQRQSHIRIERNRRKKMNRSIAILKDMLPPHQLTKNDQASVIGGVVEFICHLQQLLKTLQEEKLRKDYSEILSPRPAPDLHLPVSSSLTPPGFEQVAMEGVNHSRDMCDTSQVHTGGAKVVVTKVLTAVDVVIETFRRPRRITQILVALQSLYLNVLQVKISSENDNQTLRLAIRAEVDLHCAFSAKELAGAVHQRVTGRYLISSPPTQILERLQWHDHN